VVSFECAARRFFVNPNIQFHSRFSKILMGVSRSKVTERERERELKRYPLSRMFRSRQVRVISASPSDAHQSFLLMDDNRIRAVPD